MHLLATLDDDLYGTRAADNQVKNLSSRKANREGHSADVTAYALFRIIMALRFRRRGETVVDPVRKLVSTLTEGRGEQALGGFTIKADRGYGKESILKCLMESGIGSMLIMPEHIVRAHPFVGKSFLDPLRYDVEEDDEGMTDAVIALGSGNSSNAHTNGNNENGIRENEAQEVSGDQEGQGSSSVLPPTRNDRRRAFIVDDSPGLGPACFLRRSA